MKKQKVPRYMLAKQYLLEQIRRMTPGDNKLESEHTLTDKLGMSRETIRKAMGSLIQEGVITRRHGKGNFGHPALSNLPMRIDLNSNFRRLLSEGGYHVMSKQSEPVIREASLQMLHRMPEARGKLVVAFMLNFYGSSRLAIAAEAELLQDIVKKMPESGEYQQDMGEFLDEHCTTESNHTTAWLQAECRQDISQRFGISKESPLLCWEEVYYNLFDEKMGYIKIYFNPEIMDLSMMLKF